MWKNHKIHNKYNRDQCQVTFLTFCGILFILACLIFKHHRKWVDSSILATSYLRPTLPERPWERDCTLGSLCAAFRPHLCLAHDHCSHAPVRFSSLMSTPLFTVLCKVFNPYVAGFRLFRAGLCHDKMNTLSFLRQTFCHPFRAVGWYVFINVSHNRSYIQLQHWVFGWEPCNRKHTSYKWLITTV